MPAGAKPPPGPRLPTEKRIYAIVGAGGVGKTTVSASLALAFAARSQRTAVLTVDPARRLLEALGLEGSGGGALVEVSGQGHGPWAQALDVQTALARLVEEVAPNRSAAEALEANPVYRQLVEGEAGAEEIAAVAALYQLAADRRFEKLVLDTPPAANALEFLEAPGRLRAFLESRAIALLLAAAGVRPAGSSSLRQRTVGATTALLLRVFARATGSQLIGDLAAFLQIVSAAKERLIERARAVEELLRGGETGFLVICAADPVSTREAAAIVKRLDDLRLPVAGVVVNRVHGRPRARMRGKALQERLARSVDPALARRLAENLDYLRRISAGERAAIDELAQRLPGLPILTLPELDGEEQGLGALHKLGGLLFK